MLGEIEGAAVNIANVHENMATSAETLEDTVVGHSIRLGSLIASLVKIQKAVSSIPSADTRDDIALSREQVAGWAQAGANSATMLNGTDSPHAQQLIGNAAAAQQTASALQANLSPARLTVPESVHEHLAAAIAGIRTTAEGLRSSTHEAQQDLVKIAVSSREASDRYLAGES